MSSALPPEQSGEFPFSPKPGEDFSGEEERESAWRRSVKTAAALVSIAGLIYLSGIYQLTLYQKTPAFIREEWVESAADAEIIEVPLSVFVLESDGMDGSGRMLEDARRLAEQASRIWEQAGIKLKIVSLDRVFVPAGILKKFFISPYIFIREFEGYDPSVVNVFLLGRLGGINGFAFAGVRAVAVADYTTVYDFRVLAHEVGHILGLSHVPGNKERLMFMGANGSVLLPEEIIRAREHAVQFFGG